MHELPILILYYFLMESQFHNLAYIMGLTLSYNWKHIFL